MRIAHGQIRWISFEPENELRIGKMPNSGKPQDFADAGLKGWSRCDWVRVFGDLPAGKSR